MSWLSKKLRKLDPTSSKSVFRKGLRNLDAAVGGAKGWSKAAGIGAAVVGVAAAPFTGGASAALAAGALGATSKLTGAAAADQAARKQARTVNGIPAPGDPGALDATGKPAALVPSAFDGDTGTVLLLGAGAVLAVLLLARSK